MRGYWIICILSEEKTGQHQDYYKIIMGSAKEIDLVQSKQQHRLVYCKRKLTKRRGISKLSGNLAWEWCCAKNNWYQDAIDFDALTLNCDDRISADRKKMLKHQQAIRQRRRWMQKEIPSALIDHIVFGQKSSIVEDGDQMAYTLIVNASKHAVTVSDKGYRCITDWLR
jgi:phage anti-repressor protein